MHISMSKADAKRITESQNLLSWKGPIRIKESDS